MDKLQTVLKNIPDLYESYIKWVSSNPQVVSEVERAIKWGSYFIAGRINSSAVISELIFSLSNLLVLFNDRIITKTHTSTITTTIKYKIKLLLTTLEYCEVFIELSAHKVWGAKGRWFFITVVQMIKCFGRLLLTFEYNEKIVQSPPIAQMNREKCNTNNMNKERLNDVENCNASSSTSVDVFNGESNGGLKSSFTFTLKRSGKVLRKVEGAPPIHLRNWKPINEEYKMLLQQQEEQFERDQQNEDVYYRTPSKHLKAITSAEALYIFKPLLHLASIRAFGFNSWKSYCLALLVDFASLRIYQKNRVHLLKEQKLELSKRCVSMLLYLMRSPFYDRFTKNKIESVINGIARNVPITQAICTPILQYIPQWQNTYFYMWST